MSDTGETNRRNKRTNSGTLEGDDHPKRQQHSCEDAQPSDEGGELSEDDKKRLFDCVESMVRTHGWARTLEHIPCLQDNDTIVEIAIEEEGRALQFASDRLKNDKAIVMAAVQKSAYALEFASPTLRDDPEIVLKAVKYDGILFEYASDRLRNDRETIKQAVQLCQYAFHYVSKEVLLADRDFAVEIFLLRKELLKSELVTKEIALKVVERDGTSLIYLTDAFKADREIVWEAVKQRGYALCWASQTIRSDREFVLEAVKHSGSALRGACDALKSDREIVYEAVKQDWHALEYAPDEFKSDPEIIVEAVKQDEFWLSDDLRTDRRIVLEAVKWKPDVLRRASGPLRADHEVVLEAVRLNGLQLEYASTELRANPDIVLEAVRQNGNALQFADESLRGSRDVVLSAVRNQGEAIQYALGGVRVDTHVLAATIRSSECFTLPQDTERLLSSVIAGIRQQHDWEGGRAVSFQDAPNEVEGTAARNYAERAWKRGLRQKIWLLQQKLRSGVDTGNMRSILECGIRDEFRLANELVRLSPIFAAFADRGINWNGIFFALEMRKEGVLYLDRTGGIE